MYHGVRGWLLLCLTLAANLFFYLSLGTSNRRAKMHAHKSRIDEALLLWFDAWYRMTGCSVKSRGIQNRTIYSAGGQNKVSGRRKGRGRAFVATSLLYYYTEFSVTLVHLTRVCLAGAAPNLSGGGDLIILGSIDILDYLDYSIGALYHTSPKTKMFF